jgi:hypothetical protein
MGLTEPERDDLWPLRPAPCRGELFSSWLVRLALCYEMPVQTFCRNVWPGRVVWHGDVDRDIDDEALEMLSRKTGIAYSELFSMTLRAHEQWAGGVSTESARDLYFHSGKKRIGIRFCPGCLAERPAYFRLEWRLAFVTVCPRHRIPLLERCENCKSPCLFAKTPEGNLGRCHYCRASFRGMGEGGCQRRRLADRASHRVSAEHAQSDPETPTCVVRLSQELL